MAVGGSTVGEVRGATGNDSNGGFFCPSVSGVGLDYTQQATAQASGTDLACTGSATAVVTSASALFTSNMVGNAIQVSGGTNFTAGFYVILTYTSATQVTLDRTPAASASAASGGTWTVGGALKTLSQAFAASTGANGIAKNNSNTASVIWVQNASYAITAGLTWADGGNDLSNIAMDMLLGYNSSRGDNPTGTNRPTITISGTTNILLQCNQSNIVIENFILKTTGATASTEGLYLSNTGSSRGGRVVNVTVSGGFSTYGIYAHDSNEGQTVLINCEVTGLPSGATAAIYGTVCCIGCYVHGNACNAVELNTSNSFSLHRCIIANNTGTSKGVYSNSALDNSVILNSVFYNNGGDNIALTGSYQALTILNNIIVGNGSTGYGINVGFKFSVAATQVANYNAFYNNTSGAYHNITAGANDITLTGDPFTNGSSGDFSLNTTAGAGALCRAAGLLGAFVGGTTTGYLDVGAAQHQDPAGGGGMLINPGTAGGIRG